MYGLSDSSFAMMTANQTKRKGTTMEHDIFEKFAQLTREEQEKVVKVMHRLAGKRTKDMPDAYLSYDKIEAEGGRNDGSSSV